MTVSVEVHGEGPRTLVLVHGVGSGKEGWRNQIDAVTGAGWRFAAVDAPGFGRTPLPDGPGFGPHVDAVLEAMDSLDLDQAVLCGHSLGGMTALEIWATHPGRVQGLVLSATSPAFGRPDGDFQKEFLRSRLEPFDQGMTMPDFAAAFAPRLVGSNPQPGAVDQVVQVLSAASVEAYRLGMNTLVGFDRRAVLPDITVPTLLIAGAQDANAPAPMMQKMAGKIPGARFVELAGTGHMAPIENPAAFNQHLTHFLKGLD